MNWPAAKSLTKWGEVILGAYMTRSFCCLNDFDKAQEKFPELRETGEARWISGRFLSSVLL